MLLICSIHTIQNTGSWDSTWFHKFPALVENMKIRNPKKLGYGLAALLFSYLFFSSALQYKKLKRKNCYSVVGTVTEIVPTTIRATDVQDGWILTTINKKIKVRLIGARYKALDHNGFTLHIQPGAQVELYFLDPKHFDVLGWINYITSDKEPVMIVQGEHTILDLNRLRKRLKKASVLGLGIASVLTLTGAAFLLQSLIQREASHKS